MTKPKIDLTHPAASAGIKIYKERAILAYKLAAAKDDAVRPVYALNERTQSVQHVGSCVLLKVHDEFFALSASHVFDNVGKYQLLFGFGARLHSFAGDRFSSARGPSGSHQDDPRFVGVSHHFRYSRRNWLDLFIFARPRLGGSRSKLRVLCRDWLPSITVAIHSTGHSTKLDRYPSLELNHEHYEHLKLSREMHLLLAFEDQVLVDGKWQTAPSIRGFSGGAIFRIPNLSPFTSATKKFGEIKLAAIIIERRKGKRDRFFPAAVGTRLGVYFGLIHKYLPELRFDEMLAAEHARQTDALPKGCQTQ